LRSMMHLLPKPLHCRPGRQGARAERQAGRGRRQAGGQAGAGRQRQLAGWDSQPGVAAVMVGAGSSGARGSGGNCQQGVVRRRGGTGCKKVGMAAEAVQARRLTHGSTNAGSGVGGCRCPT
jgi:hypothetical protein